ncbi:TIR domain-containing protein [Variovorax guangxiensis]|uniref:TIR domain-containing protein n=1 Tax=Variovorax guangxiensis TaxID=1775474 RepID=A0A433MTS2_9BURK|nr:toll/interleukin-1 receptor domain-containing protein [Variovorax guangxiensis]RUR71297.1 TIR domain-containing protein [Variovorax guangxiensis]
MASVFFSYSHKDEELRNQLEAHLALLKNQGLIDAWYDRRIIAGDEVDDAIFNQLETADIILLLISSDFISSAYCFSREMTRAMERHEAGKARVIPVILRHCEWHSAPFGKLMAAPKDGKPVVSWPDRDEALADVAKQVRRAVEAISAPALPKQASRTTRPAPPSALKDSSRPSPELPRSSNLRLKQEFSEQDQDDYLRATFEFVARFFEGSIGAVGERNPDVKGNFERIDSRRFAAVLYRNGKKLAECSVRMEGLSGRNNGIAFSHDSSASQGSFNEMLSVEAGEQSLFLKALGMGWGGDERRKQLSQEGAAEYLWEMFIDRAQR